MKIVYCLPSTYRLGGVERIVSCKANLFAKNGYEVVIVTTDQDGRQPYFELDEKIKCYDLGINYYKNRERGFIKKIFYFFYNSFLHKKRLRRLLLVLKADIVISTFFNEMSVLPYINDGSKKIVEFHFSRSMFDFAKRKGLLGYVDDFMMKLNLKILPNYSRFVVLSREDAKNWKELNNVAVINNICSVEFAEKARLQSHRVITVGRYEHPKGFDRLIAAWSLIAAKIPDWTLHIVGEGSLRSELTKQIKKLNLENSVFLDGASTDIAKEYLKSSIAVFTSLYEGFLMAIVEAESAGIPVVSFDAPCGPKEIIKNGEDGFLVSDGDIYALSEKLLLLIRNKEIRENMAEKAFMNSKRFTAEQIMPQWISLFEQILKE